MKRDSQRQKIYDWETLHWPPPSAPSLTLAQCQELVDIVWCDYVRNKNAREDPPKVKFGRGRSWGSRETVCLAPWNRFPQMVLHEVAHSLQQEIFGQKLHYQAWHSPLFVRLLINLLVEYTGADEAILVSTAIIAKIDVAGRDEVPRPRRKERRP